MLKPEYLESMPENLVRMYAQLERDILADMARRLKTYDYYIPSAEHQRQKLREAGLSQQEIIKRLSSMSGKSEAELKELMKQAADEALESDKDYYRQYGMSVPDDLSDSLIDILNAGYKSTKKLFRNLTKTTAAAGQAQFVNALDTAWLQINSGAFDYNTAIKHAVKDLSKQGINAVRYPSGHRDTLEVAVRRAVVTGVNQTALQLSEQLADEVGCDLVETTAHAGARPSHAEWQGQIFSRSGSSKKYQSLKDGTGYGTGEGLGGWNCRHSFNPYVEGAPRAYSKQQLEQYNAKTIEYNGKMYTEYEASQIQRYYERQIRRWKREYSAMQAAELDGYESAVKIKKWQAVQVDFFKQTQFKQQTSREQIAGFGRKDDSQARSIIAKYSKIRYNKDGTIVVTDDWKEKNHFSMPSHYRPNAVIESVSQNGKQIDRTIYDEDGMMKLQIHSGNHGNSKQHPYGECGEHIHEYEWIEKQPKRSTRELSEQERKEHLDILRGE